ncbi:MAG: YtxH domain-containing protein [Chloroflexota bacterium]|nr:YtxH domain-containing protein [Chloroflexota bacterium]
MPSKDDFEVVIVRKDTGGGLIPGFLLGLAVGAVAGLLRSPRSGLQTRRQLTQRVQDLKSTAQSKLPGSSN